MKSNCGKSNSGFSLVEVTISIAIVAAVVLPLVALLSQGSGIVSKSEDRFATTRIIQSIESEIRFSQEKSAFFIGSENGSQNGVIKDILGSTTSGGSIYLGFDRSARLIREISKGEFFSGLDEFEADILYLVELKISKATVNTIPGVPSLVRIDFSVEQPAFTSKENRSRERLQTLLSGQ